MYNAYFAKRQKARKQKKRCARNGENGEDARRWSEGPRGIESHWREKRPRTPRELSMGESNAMSANQTLWRETFNNANFERAFERDANARHNAEHMLIWNVRRMWSRNATPEETERRGLRATSSPRGFREKPRRGPMPRLRRSWASRFV